MKVDRRTFLGRAVAGVGSALFATRLVAAKEADPTRFDPTERVPLGKTGLQVTRVGLGTGMRGWKRESNHTRMGAQKFDALVKHCFDEGIRLFDLADLYGTHPHLARALKGVPRDQYALITKVWVNANGVPEPERPPADECVHRFLKELQTDYLDVVLLHCMTDADWPAKQQVHLERLAKLKEQGKVRAHGISIHSLAAMETAAKEPWVDSVNIRINPYGKRMDAEPDKVVPVLKQLHEAGKGVVGMKIIGEGDFRNSDEQRDKSIAFVLKLGCVDAMVVGCESPAEVDDLAARVRKVVR
jgi:aryl-alcohol dehydrogenase-like predicted oxidoreductase